MTTFCAEVLQRGRHVEIPSTSEHPATDWYIDVRESVCNGIGVDAKWKHQPIHQSTSGSKPSHARTSSSLYLLPLFRQPKILQLAGVAKGLIYLHGNGIVHGDLKGVSF
jgi:hypothetical protein